MAPFPPTCCLLLLHFLAQWRRKKSGCCLLDLVLRFSNAEEEKEVGDDGDFLPNIGCFCVS